MVEKFYESLTNNIDKNKWDTKPTYLSKAKLKKENWKERAFKDHTIMEKEMTGDRLIRFCREN